MLMDDKYSLNLAARCVELLSKGPNIVQSVENEPVSCKEGIESLAANLLAEEKDGIVERV